ncbi:hypothetical protein [Variovorax paradoxus]|uniref:hypothetical protein n=1 Tax=Variovorax paradoxus TaxID=34073 RepID=UPI003D662A67
MKMALRTVFAAFFGWTAWERYWKYEDCISQSLSSCITPEGANLTGGGVFWTLPALYFSLRVVITAARYFVRCRLGRA